MDRQNMTIFVKNACYAYFGVKMEDQDKSSKYMHNLFVNIQLVDEKKNAFFIWSLNGMMRAIKSSQ